MVSYSQTEVMANLQKALANLPKTPGVYIFKNAGGKVLYVGKAINLSRRVHQYFSASGAIGPKTTQLVNQVASFKIIPTLTEFDALLLEAKLIKHYNPYYNSAAKDDRSPLYISLSLSEELPRVALVRKDTLDKKIPQRKNRVFGPFQSGRLARSLLLSLRRIVPYCTQKKRDGKPCFYTHLGFCRPCPSFIAKMPTGRARQQLVREYRRHIFRLARILSGSARVVIRQMEREMHQAAGRRNFESANQIKLQLNNLYALLSHKYDPNIYWENETSLEDITAAETNSLLEILRQVYPTLTKLDRIEAIDISNIGGRYATGSLVVMTNGRIDTSAYRRFKIKLMPVPNDVAMIAEVLKRRLKHPQWPLPDLLVIDGGKGQLTAARRTLEESGIKLPTIGLAKHFEEIVIFAGGKFLTLTLPLTSGGLHLLQRLRDEAHRFALSYHRHLRRRWNLILY